MSEWTETPVTLIVASAHVALARSLCAGIAGASGENMLTTGLSATGAAPATHYASSGKLWQSFAEMLQDAAAIEQACIEAGTPVPRSQIDAMLAASVVRSDIGPHELLQERGLKIVQEEQA